MIERVEKVKNPQAKESISNILYAAKWGLFDWNKNNNAKEI
jgi:hypothetical protein